MLFNNTIFNTLLIDAFWANSFNFDMLIEKAMFRCSRIFDQKVANLFDIVLRLSIFFDDDYLKKQSEVKDLIY